MRWSKQMQAVSVAEKQIWDIVCAIQGNLDTYGYKSVMLHKYFSDQFESKYNELVAEREGEYTAENIFSVLDSAHWSGCRGGWEVVDLPTNIHLMKAPALLLI